MISASFFGLAYAQLGISHFTTDLILTVSALILLALPVRLLRPHIDEKKVKTEIV